MSRIPSTGSTEQLQATSQGNDLRDLELDQFLKLLITEMQNQDPLDPMDNSEVLATIGQIREIGATNLLQETLVSVQQGQNLATASSLIGKEVRALDDDGQDIVGIVDRISIEVDSSTDKRSLTAHIGENKFDVANIREINNQSTAVTS